MVTQVTPPTKQPRAQGKKNRQAVTGILWK